MHIHVCYLFYFLLLINGLLTCLRGPQGRLVLPIGSPSVNKVYTYLLTFLLSPVGNSRRPFSRYEDDLHVKISIPIWLGAPRDAYKTKHLFRTDNITRYFNETPTFLK